MADQHAVLGKLTANPKINGKRVRVRKKAHIIRDGRSICNAENAYKTPPRYTPVENPEPGQVCRICLGLDGRDIPERPRHPVRRDATARTRTAAVSSDDPILTGLLGLGRAAPAESLERFELGESEYAEPLLSVLMGERVA